MCHEEATTGSLIVETVCTDVRRDDDDRAEQQRVIQNAQHPQPFNPKLTR